MIVRFVKELRLILFVIFFGILGAIYNQNVSDEWYVRYELKKSPVAEIFLKSIDERILQLDKLYLGKKRSYDHSARFFADYQFDLNNNLEKYRGIAKISEIQLRSYLSFVVDDIKKADKVAEQLIAQSNKALNKSIIDRIGIFEDEIISSLITERKLRLEDLKLTLEFYKNNKITPLSLSPSASLTIDNYILSQEDEETKQFVKDLKEDLIQYEFYNAINRFELEILKINKRKVEDNPALLSLRTYRDKVSKEIIFTIKGKNKLYNKKPSLKFSILTFGIIGLILNFVIIFFLVNRKILKKLKLEKLLTLPNLK